MDGIDDYIKQAAASVPDPGKEKIFQARDLIRTKFGQDIPDDVVNDFYNTTYLESGRSHYNRNGSVKMSPADPKDGQRAVGWSQIKPGTIAQYGLDPMDEQQNIAGGLKYFYDADPNDPVSRRIGYFSGHNSRSQKLYKTKGIIPKGGDFTGTSFQDYIAGTGGFKPVDDYIKSNGEINPNASGIDAYIQQTAKSLDTPQTAPPPTNPANVMPTPQTALPAPAPTAPVATLGGTAPTPATPPTPAPESANTLQAQMASTIDANSPRSAVLLANGNPVNDYILNSPEAKAMTRVDTPNGPLLVNAAKLKLQPSQVADYVKQNGFAGLIGKAADVGNDTTQNPAVLTTDPKTGTELSASSAPTPEAAAQQAQIDQQAFPGSQTQVVSPQDVIDNRANGNPFPPPVDASMAGSPEYQAYNEMADRSQAAGYPDGTAPLDNQAQQPAASQQAASQPQKQPRSQQQPASDGSSVSVSLNPGDFKIDGTPVTQINESPQPVEAKTDADILKGQATSLDLDVSAVPANADFNKFATEQALRKAAAQYGIDDAKLQEYIANRKAFTDFTPEEIDYYRKNKINPTVNVTNGVVNDLLNYANGTTGIDPALRQNIDLQSSQWRQETEAPNLTMPRDFAQEDAAWLNKNAAPIAVAVNPLAVFLPEDMQNDIGASLVGGAAGSGARLWRTLAGIARPINGDLYDEMRQIASANERLESATGTGGAVSHIYKFAGALPGDFSRIYLLTRIPGAAGTVIGMAADQGFQSSGRGESPAQIAKQTVKGGLTGGVLVAAPLSGAVLSGITRKVIPAAVGELGTVILGTAKVSQLFGTPSDKALQEGLLNGLLHLANKGVSMKGKVVRAKSSDGATADVYVDPSGSVKLLKGEVAKPDAEMYVEVEKDANGVYRAKNDITPERTPEDPYSRGNRGNVLGEAPAKRIPEPDPEAVKAVSIDTKAQKVADALADGTPKSLSEIAKAIRSNPGKTQDTVMNLYAAGKIEILPDNKVRLIENVLPSLYDQFDENGRIVPPKADVSQSTAPVVQGENVPQGTSDSAPAVPLNDGQAAERTPEPTANMAAEYKGLTVDHPTSGDRLTFTGETNKNGNLLATNQFGRERTVSKRDADKWLAEQGGTAPATGTTPATVTHPNPAIDGQPILTTTPDGRSVVANPENKSGVSIVTDRSETPQTTTQPRPTTTRFRSLSQFVRANGGIRATKYDSGEHQRISNKETGTTGIINRNSKFTAEQMAEKAWEAGYLRTEWPTIADRNGNDLMGYIEDDIASHKTTGQGRHYSQADIEAIQGDIAEQEAEYRRQQDNAEQAAADYAKQQDEMLTAQQRALADPEVQNLLEKLQEPGQYKTDSAIGAPLNEITAKYLDALERHGITDQYTPGELIDAYRHRKASANDAAGDSAPADEVQPQGDNGTGSERAAETAPVIPQRTSTVSTPSTPTPVTNPEPLTAAMRARVQYALDRKQIVSDIAQRYNLTEEQVRSVQPLQPVGSNGQISYKLRQNFLPNKVETDAGRAEKVAMVNDLAGELGLAEARVTRDTPNADIMNAFDLIRLTIARSFGHDRSSQMSRENWLDFLDARAGSLAEPTVAGMIDALEHQAAWNLKAEPFVNDKNLAQVLDDIDAKYGLANVADFPSLDKEFRARINAIGESYGLKRHAIQKLFSDTFLDLAQEEHGQTGDGRTGQEVSNPVTPQETRGGEPQEQPRDQEVVVAGLPALSVSPIDRAEKRDAMAAERAKRLGEEYGVDEQNFKDPEDAGIQFSNAFDQTDLFGNPVTPQVSQGSLPFAAPTFTDSGRVKDMEQAYGKPTADYIEHLTNSEDPKLYRTAIKLSDARFMVMQKGEAARQIVEDAADALDTFALARQTQSPVDAVLAQQNLDGSGTVADNISPRAAEFAKAMETGAFSRDFERALSEAKTESEVQFAQGNDPMAVINLVKRKLSHFIDRFLAGELKRGESGTVLPVTPDVYRRFGARDLSIEIEPKTLDKVLRNAYKHAGNISRKHIEELPIQLVNPVAIARYVDPQTREQSINVLTGMQDGSGQPIVAGIKFNKKVGRYDVHLVSTVHGKDTRYNFDDWPDKLLYVNTKIARSLPATVPIYGKVVQEAQRANTKILTEIDFVKKPDGDIQYNNYTRSSAKTGARLSSGYPGTDSRGIIESLPQKALAFNDANDSQFSRDLQAPNPAERRAERRELRKKVSDAGAMSDTALTAAAKFSVNPQTRALELNVPGLMVFTRAVRAIPGQQDSSFTGITFNHRSTPKIQAVFDNAVNVLNATGQPRQAARVQAMADAVRAATDPQYGDLIAVLADPSLPLAHRHATQEEMTHRADNRIKEKYQTTFDQTPFIGSRAYATAQKHLMEVEGYPISAVHREIIAKIHRDDAADALGLTDKDVDELKDLRYAQLSDAGVPIETLIEHYGGISNPTDERINQYGQANNTFDRSGVRESDAGRGSESDNRLRSSSDSGEGSGIDGQQAVQRAEYRPDAAGLRQGSLSQPGQSGDVIGSRIGMKPAQTETPAFRRWFADSKVVDANGQPLIVKHGSVDGIPEFEDRGKGIYFTSSDDLLDGYTRQSFFRGGKESATVPAYLSLQNPLILDAQGTRNDNIPVPWAEWKPKVFGNLPKNAVSVADAYKYAIAHGHDGLIVKNVVDTADPSERVKAGDVYAVKSPDQIIPAFGDPESDLQFARNTVTRKVFDTVDKLFQTDSALSTTKALENIVNKGMQQLKAADEDAYEQVLKLAGTQVQATLAAVNNPDIAPDFYSELKRHNLENVRITLEMAGLAQPVTPGTDLSVMPKIMGKPSTTMHVGDKLYIVPKWLAAELRPALDKPQDANLIQKVMDKLDVYGMSGPLDLFYHGTNIIATVIGGTPYAGTDILSRTIGNTPVTKWLTTAINIWRSDPEHIDPSVLREMAEAGVLSSRYAKTTYSANLAARSPLTEKVSILPSKDGLVPDLSPLLNGPKGLDIRARILLWQIGKHMNPNASVTDMADFVNQAGIYNNMLQSQMVRFLKNSRIGRFAVAGTTMSKNGLLMWLNKSPLPNEDLPFVSRTWLRTQQQLGGGPLGVAVLLWLGASLLYRGMFPWKDPESRFMQIPLNPKERNSPFVRKIAGDTGSVYVNLGFFSPLLERGARGLGISGAYNEGILGGNSTQMAEAGLTDVMNTALHPIASSPTTKAVFVAATGKEMQIKSLRKDGESNLQMWETPIPKDSGVGRKLFEGALDLNPFVGNIFHTFGVNRDPAKPSQLAKDELGFILRTTTDIALPRLVKGPSDRSKARAAIQKERRLMEYPRRRQ